MSLRSTHKIIVFMKPKVAIIIVSWNVKELLKRAILSIEKEADTTFELFVIDNASSDGTGEYLKTLRITNQLCAKFDFILNDFGKGFAAGCNLGIKLSDSEYVLLFAPDAEMFPKTMSELVAAAERHQGAGVVGGKILNENGTIQASVSKLPTPMAYAGGRLQLHKIFSQNKKINALLRYDFDYEREAVVPSVKGAIFLITPIALEKVGMLDERFFIWFEETDYCNRVARAGLKVIYTPNAKVMHIGLASMKKMSFWSRQLIWNNSMRAYFTKYFGTAIGTLLGILDPLLVMLGSLGLKGSRFIRKNF